MTTADMPGADVTVMGGGIFGLSVGYACAQRGARVQVIERQRIGAGSSGGLVGALAPHVPENWNAKKEFQLDSLLMARDFWSGVQTISGIDPGYARGGRLQPLADPAAVVQAERRDVAARGLWRGQADWRIVDGADDWRGVSPSGLWVQDTLSARLHPRQALQSLAAAIRALGGSVIELGEPVTARGGRVPPAGVFGQRKSADKPDRGAVVWACGVAGLEALGADLGRTVGGGVKGQAALFACAAADQPQLFVDGLHIVPHGDGTVAVGSTSERVWDASDSTDAVLDAVIARARAACPMLADAPVIERWAGLRPRATSRAPVLGAWPGRAGHFIANGGFKIGFGMAPMVADVMAGFMLEGRDRIPAGFRIQDCHQGGRVA